MAYLRTLFYNSGSVTVVYHAKIYHMVSRCFIKGYRDMCLVVMIIFNEYDIILCVMCDLMI